MILAFSNGWGFVAAAGAAAAYAVLALASTRLGEGTLRSLLLAAGNSLLREQLPAPGRRCGSLTLLHQRPSGDTFTAISLLDQACTALNRRGA